MKDSIKKRIIEKGRDLLFTKTEEEITMNLIANELNITAPTLYHYFKGKDELLTAANQLIVDEISAHLDIKFPPSIPFEMRIITAVAMTGDYFMKTGLPASYLIEDPRERPIVLGEFRKKLAALCAEYKKSGKNKNKLPAEQMAYRLLSCIAADIAFYRNSKKALPEDFAEKVWQQSCP
ncbi:MAG TPA: TetR/AcrR family transcriptional regulator [bacterium]|nr:TetR/AcrR family transcriptional regulator [bacterium]